MTKAWEGWGQRGWRVRGRRVFCLSKRSEGCSHLEFGKQKCVCYSIEGQWALLSCADVWISKKGCCVQVQLHVRNLSLRFYFYTGLRGLNAFIWKRHACLSILLYFILRWITVNYLLHTDDKPFIHKDCIETKITMKLECNFQQNENYF